MTENPAECVSQNAKAKSRKARLVAQVARLVKKEGLDYEGWRYVAKRVRRLCELRPEKKGRRLPRVLTSDEFRRFYQIVDRAEDVQHALMLRLLFFTAVRISELCNFGIADVDLEACKIRSRQEIS
jgi:integrase/recombinase XerD